MGRLTHILRDAWRFLGSTRLAIILLAALLLAVLLASLLPQLPADPAARGPWLAAAQVRYRGASSLLNALGLLDAVHSPWFLALLSALSLNTAVCTLQRLPRLWRSLSGPLRVARPESFYQSSAQRAEWPLPSLEAGLSAAEVTLARHRYRTFLERDAAAGVASLYGERGRWGQACTLLSHLAVVLLLLAVLARPALSWREEGVLLHPGQVQAIPRHPGLAVRAGSLAIDRYADGQPRNYRVPLAVLVDASPLLTETVRLNHPLTFRGITFHLKGYGPALHLVAPEGSFDLAFSGDQAAEVTLPEAGLSLRLAHQPEAGTLFVEASTIDGDLLGSGSVADGDEIEIQGTPIAFRLGLYTTWQIGHDPTFAPVLGAAILLLSAMLISLWVPQRRLWLRIDGQVARMAAASDLEGEFATLAAEMATVSGAAQGAVVQPASVPPGEADGC